MTTQTNLTPVQDPIIRSHAKFEMTAQTIILSVVAAGSYWLFSFEVALLLLLVLAFGFNTLNVIAGATSTNVQIAELRDFLKKQTLSQ